MIDFPYILGKIVEIIEQPFLPHLSNSEKYDFILRLDKYFSQPPILNIGGKFRYVQLDSATLIKGRGVDVISVGCSTGENIPSNPSIIDLIKKPPSRRKLLANTSGRYYVGCIFCVNHGLPKMIRDFESDLIESEKNRRDNVRF